MSNRERWIVYPLLFLALGAALRDKVVPPSKFSAQEITTNRLRVGHVLCSGQCQAADIAAGRLQADQVVCGASECKALIVQGRNGRPTAVIASDPASGTGVVEAFSAATGTPLTQLRLTDTGGIVFLFSQTGRGLMINEAGQLVPLDVQRVEPQLKPEQPKNPKKAKKDEKKPSSNSPQSPR